MITASKVQDGGCSIIDFFSVKIFLITNLNTVLNIQFSEFIIFQF